MEAGGEVTREQTRIYVGGLGGGVTEDDIRKTFSALGEVVAVEVVRTKGRSFAYLDFLPSNDKSLPKLFSTYNGCMWKGGKLRLEKAKEHYLLQLRREWQEDSERASKTSNSCNANPSESRDTSEKPKKVSLADKMHLRIFFPKLQKVKSLASVGIGKHKYSFQRVQVPSVPTHFCDCEEHSRPFLTTDRKQSSEIEDGRNGINEQELNLMNSVMNKILERENPSKQVIRKSESVNGKGSSIKSNDEFLAVEKDDEDHLSDEDNLIINVATGKSDGMDLLAEMKTMMANLEPVANGLRTSEKPKNVQNSQKNKTLPLNKKRKSPHSEENEGYDTMIPETARNSQILLNAQEDGKTELELATKQSGNNSLRSLKSTWKDLIGQKGNRQFNISDIIATVTQEKEDELKGNIDPPITKNIQGTLKKKNLNKKRKLDGDRTSLVTKEIRKPDILQNESQQEGEELRTDFDIHPSSSQLKELEPTIGDLDMTLTTISRQFRTSDDVLPSVSQQKEEEPRTDDDLDMLLTSNAENKSSDKHENEDSQMGISNDLEKPVEASPTKHNEDMIRTARGDSWRHKSSWTQLISNSGNNPFSISQVVPNLSSEKPQQVDIHKDGADTLDLQPENKNLDDQSPDVVLTDQTFSENFNATGKNGVLTSPVEKNTSERKRILSLGNLESDETCLFMRTEASMKEWKKAKASLNGSLNKKKRSVQETT